MVNMDKKFEEDCILKGNAVPFTTRLEAQKKFHELNNNAEYLLRSAQNLLKSDTPNTAVADGFFAMEHKANALIALHGYSIKNHECTPIALSRVLERKDLAQELSEASKLRIVYNYRLDLKSKNEKEVKDFIEKTVIYFIKEIDVLITKKSRMHLEF